MSVYSFWVYLLTNNWGNVLYVGHTSDLARRIQDHREKKIPGFTSRYNVSKLVYFEKTTYVYEALRREKQIKGWTRAKKEALVQSINPERKDLFNDRDSI